MREVCPQLAGPQNNWPDRPILYNGWVSKFLEKIDQPAEDFPKRSHQLMRILKKVQVRI